LNVPTPSNPNPDPYRQKLAVPTNDPAWQPPSDPSKDAKTNARIILREIPTGVVQTGWTITETREAIASLVYGNFAAPAQLWDAVTGDSRVQSAMASRIGGLMGRELRHQIPAHLRDSSAAKECHAAWVEHWPSMATEPVMRDMISWGVGLGFQASQILWDTSSTPWKPYLVPFHPRFTFYQWQLREIIAITQDGPSAITGGDGHWVLHAPSGRTRGWMNGAVRAIAPWWLARNYGLRDWARYSERHGMPIGLAETPSGGEPEAINAFRLALAQLGQESILQLPHSDNPEFGKYDFKWLETDGSGWQGFQQLIAQCNAEITLAVLGQNLTSEVKEGSFAAARVHADVRQAILESDARALADTIYKQIARPYAAINFGDPELAPRPVWDIVPYEDHKALADTFNAFTIGVSTLKSAGYKITRIEDFARQFGLTLGSAAIVPVVESSQKEGLITPTDKAAIVKVNEARADAGLPAAFGEDGELTVAQFKAFNEAKGESEGADEGAPPESNAAE